MISQYLWMNVSGCLRTYESHKYIPTCMLMHLKLAQIFKVVIMQIFKVTRLAAFANIVRILLFIYKSSTNTAVLMHPLHLWGPARQSCSAKFHPKLWIVSIIVHQTISQTASSSCLMILIQIRLRSWKFANVFGWAIMSKMGDQAVWSLSICMVLIRKPQCSHWKMIETLLNM